jgi:tetratricopeptide (TPR) repeat protein
MGQAIKVLAVPLAVTLGLGSAPDARAEESAAATRTPNYVTASLCAECHRDAYESWRDSHHAWALREATAETVLGDFDNRVFEHHGVRSRFFRQDGRYFVETEGPDGKPAAFELKYTVGVTPLQQYLIELDGGRLQTLDIAWDVVGKRWFHVFPGDDTAAGNGLHWSGSYKNWQARCAVCHQTDFAKGYDARSRTYQTTWSDKNVACEACHGPGEAHVAWARDPGTFQASRFAGVDPLGLLVRLDSQDPEAEIQTCAGCHSRRQQLDADSPPPGSPFAEHYIVAGLRDGLYYADGQILDEVYVYGSFLQSRMYASGVRCSDCHDPHSGDLVAAGNAVCTQCHGPAGKSGFPTLEAATYDSPGHHRHQAGSPGALCVSCHMPARTYMIVDPRRDHSFRVPRPDLSAKLGTPNACTGCHDDKSDAWVAAQVAGWYPEGRAGTPHFAETFSAARKTIDARTGDALVAIAKDRQRPAIVRATALGHLRAASDPALADRVADLLEDEFGLVRGAAVAVQDAAPAPVRAQRLAPLLADPLRSVRIAAGRSLVGLPLARLPDRTRRAMQAAVREFQRSLLVTADFPETQMSLAGLAFGFRNLPAAREALRTALAMDPQLGDAWLMLARIAAAEGRLEDARATVEQGIAALPESGPLHQSLGNILLELGQDAKALVALETARRLMPEDATVLADLGMTYGRRKDHQRAIDVLERAVTLAASDPEVVYLLARNHLALGQRDKAKFYASVLATRHPGHPLNGELDRALASGSGN